MDEHHEQKRPPHLDRYQAYLIRIWQDGQFARWRASAQAVQGGEVRRFASLPDLFAFLEANTNSAQPPEGGNEKQAS